MKKFKAMVALLLCASMLAACSNGGNSSSSSSQGADDASGEKPVLVEMCIRDSWEMGHRRHMVVEDEQVCDSLQQGSGRGEAQELAALPEEFFIIRQDIAGAVRGVALKPVSYTHLDVYKRQARFCEGLLHPLPPAVRRALPGRGNLHPRERLLSGPFPRPAKSFPQSLCPSAFFCYTVKAARLRAKGIPNRTALL